MRREGRQHGMVLTLEPSAVPHPPSHRRRFLLGGSGSPPTTAFRTRVAMKPTNHSKYTGKPTEVRQQPSSKSRDKSKGARKSRDLDVGLNPRLASWRVSGGGGRCGMAALSGASASAAAVYLSGYPLFGQDCGYDKQKWLEEHEDPEVEEEEEEVEVWGGGDTGMACEVVEDGGDEEGQIEEGRSEGGGFDDTDEEDGTSFCEILYAWDYVDEEDWCVVEDMEM